jgi:hypothetical protein
MNWISRRVFVDIVFVLVDILWMDRLVRLFHGGIVKSNGEFESMHSEPKFFSSPPSFHDLVSHCRDKFGWPLSFNGRFDCGKERAHYVLMPFSCEDEWKDYKDVVKSSSVRCLEVVVQKGSSPLVVPMNGSVDVEPIENLTQEEEELVAVPVREDDRACEDGALGDDFDEEAFDDDDGMYDSISEGSEDDEGGVAYEVEDDLTSGEGASDVVLEDEYRSLPSSEDEEGECCEVGFQESL